MVDSAKSSSAHWREQGNAIYITAKDGLPPVIKKDRLRNAANYYYKAFNSSDTEDEKVSAAKNLGMVSWKTAKVDEATTERITIMIHMYKEAFKYFSFAYYHSESVKPQEWQDNLLSSARSCWEEAKVGRITNQDTHVRASAYLEIVDSLEFDEMKAECYIELATCHFHAGISSLQNGDFKGGLCELRECYMPVNEAKRYGTDRVTIQAEIRILEEDIFMHQCMAESMQARHIGDSLFDKIKETEELNMDLVWDIIDWYKQAVVRTREVTEVEMEAIALSRLGRVYDKVLKIKYKAKEYLMRSMQLAHSMHPRTFNSEEWFKDCAEILERYQQETVQAEEEKWRKEREGILKDIQKQINNLKKNDDEKEHIEFLKYVYRVFPPKNTEHKLEGVPRQKYTFIEHDKTKKLLQKAVIHYHPDKVDTEKHGKVWKVLSEEITKILTRRYERMK
ncbi:hypothetical protein FSP39_020577 [Pinctada imbricata]|uniref:J domain-containing protein n=1 Tax=Pinctada imbricata TaxID=66713 RepID=A0AA88XP80_PINIB|nr:hypothetical protein FSP39_020577 [Pinctada imbricata]